MIWRAGGARFREGAQAAISVQSPDSGLTLLDRKTEITEFTGAVSESGDTDKAIWRDAEQFIDPLCSLCPLWLISLDSELKHSAAVVDLGVPAHAEIPCNPERLMHCQLKTAEPFIACMHHALFARIIIKADKKT
jgi:hypothetical protein